ncbi:MAG TPA: ATPase, T2SS/T4P/T4SS family [Candidatus Ozemobacteraceae bacterium]|nr:ATPase, T2SS/T4P/T4SS family [Candidatus Ozemobacteraceae bacterium]
MPDLLTLLKDLRQANTSDVHITPDTPVFVRKNGFLEPLKDCRFSEADIKKIILGTSTPKAREILGKSRQVNYAFLCDGVPYRFAAFFDKGRFALTIRIIPAVPPKFADLGLPDTLKKALSKNSGLIIVSSPSGQGKTTTIASILDFINTHFEKNIITVENPVEIRFKDDKSSFIQRSIPLDVPNFYEGLSEAYRLDPDIVVSDSLNYRDAMDQALFLCEAGCLVIGATDGGTCQQVLERIIYSRPAEERDSLRGKLATHLNVLISQKLAPRSDHPGQVGIFDILVNTPQVKSLIRNENLVMLKTIQEQDSASSMQTFDRHLMNLVRKNVISAATAVALADDSFEMAARFSTKGRA